MILFFAIIAGFYLVFGIHVLLIGSDQEFLYYSSDYMLVLLTLGMVASITYSIIAKDWDGVANKIFVIFGAFFLLVIVLVWILFSGFSEIRSSN